MTMTPDDPFDQIIAGIDLSEPTDVVDVSTLSDPEISFEIAKLNNLLIDMGQVRYPHTQEARDIHSMRNALIVEQARRLHGQ